MKIDLEKNIDAINTAIFQSVGTTRQVIHETVDGKIIIMKGLRTVGDDFYSKERLTGAITLIAIGDKIYIQDSA